MSATSSLYLFVLGALVLGAAIALLTNVAFGLYAIMRAFSAGQFAIGAIAVLLLLAWLFGSFVTLFAFYISNFVESSVFKILLVLGYELVG
ncbi:MAG: hypothetical protein AAFX40_19035, partial [Cyanobacteria bacterium J06639_1]